MPTKDHEKRVEYDRVSSHFFWQNCNFLNGHSQVQQCSKSHLPLSGPNKKSLPREVQRMESQIFKKACSDRDNWWFPLEKHLELPQKPYCSRHAGKSGLPFKAKLGIPQKYQITTHWRDSHAKFLGKRSHFIGNSQQNNQLKPSSAHNRCLCYDS